MKKVISCLVVMLLGLPLAALDEQMLERDVLSTQQVKTNSLPELSQSKQERFYGYLDLAKIVMRQNQEYVLKPEYLGEALFWSVSLQMKFQKDRTGQTELTKEEIRGVFYAINLLLDQKYCKGLPLFSEYATKYPVKDWSAVRTASATALQYVYQAVRDIALEKPNYRVTWLFFMKQAKPATDASAAQAPQVSKVPQLPQDKKERFTAYLNMAQIIMRQDTTNIIGPEFLGNTLAGKILTYMQIDKKSDGSVQLTNEEKRALYFALYRLLPRENCASMMSPAEYRKEYPVQDWNAWRTSADKALQYVYQAVKDIATEKDDYRLTWLGVLSY